MPYKDPKKKAECHRAYYQKNKEKLKAYSREYQKEYPRYHTNTKANVRSSWKHNNKMNVDEFEMWYETYQSATQCYTCEVSFAIKKKHMDHNHTTTYPRFVVCPSCNSALRHTDLMFRLTMNELKHRFRPIPVFENRFKFLKTLLPT